MIKLKLPVRDIAVTQYFGENRVDFYKQMKGIVPQEGIALVEELIRQEKEHKRLLEEIKNQM